MSDIIIWLLILFVFLIIAGLYISEFSTPDLSKKQQILDLQINNVVEYFKPSFSDTSDQTEGASELYNWGLPNDVQDNPPPNKCPPPPPPPCPTPPRPVCPPPPCPTPPPPCPTPPPPCPSPPPSNSCCNESTKSNNNKICSTCDITLNKDIDKYVLKSSVPPCPDMSDYITKNMINPNIDLNNYILKSEIKPCDKIDISKYILKSEIPPCPTCPVCPECPICPVCPKFQEEKCKKIYDYKISDHPDFDNYIRKDQINKYISNKIQNNNTSNNSQNINESNNNNINSGNNNNNSNSNNNNKSKEIITGNNSGNKADNNSSINAGKNISNSISQYNKDTIKSEERPDINNYHLCNYSIKEETVHNADLMGYYAGDSLFAGV